MELKKNPKIDLKKKSGLLLNIGLALSLIFSIVAFEWKNYDESALKNLGNLDDLADELMDIPLTEMPPPPPPKVQIPEIVEVPDEEEIEEEIEVELDVELTEETVIEDIVFEEAPEDENADEIFEIVEEPASFPGGLSGFYKYLKDEMKYPRQAQRMGIDGRVFVQFVIEINGSLTDIHVVKGIGAGCDEEAVRVLKNSPKWKPGKQRGKAVRQKMVQAVLFRLAK